MTVDNTDDETTRSLMHIGDLDGAVRSQKSQWAATVTVTVVAQVTSGVTVKGTWTSTGTAVTCTTGPGGTCSLDSPLAHKTTESQTLRVDDVARPDLTYEPGLNTDPDGDSDGTTITIVKAGRP